MGKHTDIQWCHSTVNPVAGCDGCELYPSGAKVAQTMLKEIPPQMRQQVRDRIDHFAAQGPQYVKLNLDVIAGEVAELAGAPEIKRPVADAVAALYVCYAASLHRFFNKNGRSSGYAFPFEQPKLFDGRMARAAAWGPPSNEEECSKPWLSGMRRLIFISDMGDALSTAVPFEHLEREIIQNVSSEQGQQHIWQWLTKRPGRMAKFAEWLEQRGQQWPENLVAMTTVTAKEFTSRVSALRDVPAKFKGLSLELCLHPNAVREACRVLYDLPKTGNWQVMVTTHSPVFIDLWRDNTSIVRVERQPNGSASGTTIYRPKRAALDDDDKECLKLLNLCDSYVAEFFFGGRTVLVEGDTEHTAFTYVMQQEPERFKDIHVVRARGKATIVSLCKVLNQFGAPYSVLHDSDTPTAFRKGTVITNPAWTQNQRIYDQVKNLVATRKIRLVASLVSFEPAYFGTDASSEKPANAWTTLKENKDAHVRIATLLEALVDFTKPLPQGAVEWSDLAALENQLPKNPA